MMKLPFFQCRQCRQFFFVCLLLLSLSASAYAQRLLIPMDKSQNDHLKAYGLVYWCLQEPREYKAKWLLNYRAGSFLLEDYPEVRQKANLMGVAYKPLTDLQLNEIYQLIERSNMDEVLLEKAPKIAVYVPPTNDPWDDAVTLAIEYAEIPYTKVWDEELLSGQLNIDTFDWLHLHHEDFTGQFGKFYGSYKHADWYQRQVEVFQKAAWRAGFATVPRHKGAVAEAVKDYVLTGGFLFAMCSAPETLDIALSTEGGKVDIVAPELDGTPIDPQYESSLNFSQTFSFQNFILYTDPNRYEYSNIDNPTPDLNPLSRSEDLKLFEFAAKHDPVPTMLTQDHVSLIKGFLGQTTSFNRNMVKDSVTILSEIEGTNYVKYIHGTLGKGTFTFLGGHDPEDYRHEVGEAKTNLSLHKNSPGYRLILNNILFPAAKQRKQKT